MRTQFRELFERLTGKAPFPWQTALGDRFLTNDIPAGCDLPTGMGKTSVIPIWVICLGLQAMTGYVQLPRRLVYTVNRRVIVDQATEEVNRIVDALAQPLDPQVSGLREALAALSVMSTGLPIAVSTLRGGLADNQEWKADPTKPAIVIGTVDMIGSKLLFCGFGDGRRDRPLHAGLLGQDALIVHDESHLMPAFGQSLRQAYQLNQEGAALRPFRIMDLSATQTCNSNEDLFSLTPADYGHPAILQRLGLAPGTGRKQLVLSQTPPGEVVQQIVARAAKHDGSGTAVLIYVRTVAHARKIQEGLRKRLADQGQNRLLVLTGTLRGYERDRLTADPNLTRFAPERDRHQTHADTVYLISTAAGEVGANYDADHCVCDLTTLESIIQRFGRVNRFGLFPESRIEVVGEMATRQSSQQGKQNTANPLSKTWEALQQLNGDASPAALSRLVGYQDAYSPPPQRIDLDDWTLDSWSITGLRPAEFPQRPDVALWLHGLTDAEPPETHIAWRDDLNAFQDLDRLPAETWWQDYLDVLPLHRQELLKEPTWEVKKALKAINHYWTTQGRQGKALWITADGEVVLNTLAELAEQRLDWGTVILPTALGGLSEAGLLDTSPRALTSPVTDVADEPGKRERLLVQRQQDSWVWRQGPKRMGTVEASSLAEVARQLASEHHYSLSTVLEFTPADPDMDDDEMPQRALVILSHPEAALPAAGELSAYAKRAQELDAHLHKTEEAAQRLVARLDLPQTIAEAVCLAARWHDQGKDRRHWQKAIGNFTSTPLAKSGHTRFNRHFTRGYRHELGSLFNAEEDPVIRQHPERDLILHLIAAHHGYARPGFPERAYDRTKAYPRNEQVAQETLQRFASLQRRFGWWQLAWLEALVKSADAMGGPA